MVTLFLFSGNLIPYNNQHYSGAGRFVREYMEPTSTETAFVRDVINSSAKAIGSKISNKMGYKGGFPEFDDSEEHNPKYVKSKSKRGNKDGRGKGSNGNGSNNGNSKTNFTPRSEAERGSPRGYQTQSGTNCILLNSGISSGLTVNTRIVTNDYTPIYLASGYLFKVTDANIDRNTAFNDQLINIIYPLIESVISNRIQRYAGRYINSVDYSSYILSIIESLQVYYCIDNVLAYGSNVSRDNINVGMEYLRSKLTSEAIVEFNLLREIICTCVCPPNLLNYIRFMCQSFRTSDAPHSPIIKLNIGGMFDEQWTLGSSQIAFMIKQCRDNIIKSNKVISYLYQAFPNWLISTPPESSNVACFNNNFMTFWHNQNCCYLSTSSTNKGNFEYSIEVANMDAYTDYQIHQRDVDVDGLIFISQTYNIPAEGKKQTNSYWGVWQPLASVDGKQVLPGRPYDTFNLKCFSVDGNIQTVTDETKLGSSGIYNLVYYSGTSGSFLAARNKFGAHGFVKLQNVSVRMQSEAFNNAMRYLFI